MNLLKEKGINTGSYYCTWCTQDMILKRKDFKKIRVNSTRDALNEEFLFGELGVLNMIEKDLRSDLIVVIDDGWDVPYGLDPNHCNNNDNDLNHFGSLELNLERFPSFTGTFQERLKKLSDKIKSLGYAGLGLWVSPQVPFKRGIDDNAIVSKDYWIERLKWCAYADIRYWKIDWGINGFDDEYRKMIYDNAKIYAPNVKIEQTFTIAPFDLTREERDCKWYQDRIKRLAKMQGLADYIRIYDVTMAFFFTTSVNRTIEMFKAAKDNNNMTDCIINLEDFVYGAAALGCTFGAMRMSPIESNSIYGKPTFFIKPNSELKRAIRWQRIAPPFAVKESIFEIDETMYRDSYYFPEVEEKTWPYDVWGSMKIQDSYASISRNMPLPKVVADNEKPYVFSSINPKTNALSVFASPRSFGGNVIYTFLADVSIKGKSSIYPVGIFGHYKSLTIEFEDNIEGKTIYAQDLACDEAIDITNQVIVKNNKLVIDGKLIDKIGLTIKEVETELPGLILKVI